MTGHPYDFKITIKLKGVTAENLQELNDLHEQIEKQAEKVEISNEMINNSIEEVD